MKIKRAQVGMARKYPNFNCANYCGCSVQPRNRALKCHFSLGEIPMGWKMDTAVTLHMASPENRADKHRSGKSDIGVV